MSKIEKAVAVLAFIIFILGVGAIKATGFSITRYLPTPTPCPAYAIQKAEEVVEILRDTQKDVLDGAASVLNQKYGLSSWQTYSAYDYLTDSGVEGAKRYLAVALVAPAKPAPINSLAWKSASEIITQLKSSSRPQNEQIRLLSWRYYLKEEQLTLAVRCLERYALPDVARTYLATILTGKPEPAPAAIIVDMKQILSQLSSIPKGKLENKKAEELALRYSLSSFQISEAHAELYEIYLYEAKDYTSWKVRKWLFDWLKNRRE